MLAPLFTGGVGMDAVTDLEAAIEAAWEARDTLSPQSKGPARDAIEQVISMTAPCASPRRRRRAGRSING